MIQILSCANCFGDIGENAKQIFEVVIFTENKIITCKIDYIKERLAEWIAKKNYHLTASEIILYRPDILNNFIKRKYGDCASFVIMLVFYCNNCFLEWEEKHPLT